MTSFNPAIHRVGFACKIQESHDVSPAKFAVKTTTIFVTSKDAQDFGPYTLVRGEQAGGTNPSVYRLTIACNLPPANVSILNVENNKLQTFTLKQSSQVITLERGMYNVTMDRSGDIRKRRVDFTGSIDQLTFSVEFRPPASH